MQIPNLHQKPFLISLSVFLGVLLVHLAGIYIYEGGKYVGLPGGSISIGIVGKAPDVMNPFTFGTNPANDLVFEFLFRGLIRYNSEQETIEGDAATCDLSTLSKITCKLKNGVKWSDGTPIQDGDVVASFDAFREESKNEKIKTLLSKVSVGAKNGTITFSSKEKDPLILELLSYPILRSDMIEQVRTNRFSTGNYITSGLYTFGESVTDTEYGFDRITLVKNPLYSEQSAWLDKVHFKFFGDMSSLERSTEALSVIVPPVKNEKLTLSARFDGYEYTMYEFFGVFFNTDRLSKTLRNGLHWQIGTSFSGSVNPEHRAVESIFLGGDKILPTGNLGNFPDILRKSGYLRKDEILANIDKTPTTLTGGFSYEQPKFFENKANSLVLFADTGSGGIILRGNVPKGADSVSINGYTLREYRPGNETFVYRVGPENATLTGGKNTYTLSFGPENFTGETLTLYYDTDSGALAKYREAVDAEYLARLNTPALVAARERAKASERAKVEALDDHYYYNAKYEPFKLKVAYMNGVQSTEQYALVIEQTLKNLSIIAELTPLEGKDLEEIIRTGEKGYDILVAGVSAAGNIASLGQLFSSSEAGKGVNFANIESKTLDELFASLGSVTTQEDVTKTKNDIIEFMKNESFFFPLSSPIHTFYVDRNLKGVRKISTLPDVTTLYDIFQYTSIKDSFTINTEGKGIFGFFGWIIGKVF